MTTAAVQFASNLDGPPDPELVRIRDLVYQVAGIFHPDNKRDRFSTVVAGA